jgi:hypothetical protein
VRQDAQPRRNCEDHGGFCECSFIAVESENIWANRKSFLLAPRRHASQSGRYPVRIRAAFVWEAAAANERLGPLSDKGTSLKHC